MDSDEARYDFLDIGEANISWKFRWSRNGRKVGEIEHRGHQIEDFDSEIHIPRSKYSRKAEKSRKWPSKVSQLL